MIVASSWGSDGSPAVERLRDEAAAHERAGRWDEAIALYGDLLRTAGRKRNGPLVLYALLATTRALHHSGNYEAAEETGTLALEITRAGGMAREQAKAMNLLGIIRHKQGDRHAARRSYEGALDLAREEQDAGSIAAICQNLGVIANELGDLREARALYLEGICSCVRTGSAATAATIYNNLGMVCADLGEFMEAEIHFLRGIEIAERLEMRTLLARLCTGRAEPLIRTGEFRIARQTLKQAERLALELDDQGALADVERYRAALARREGNPERAEAHIMRAIAIAAGAGAEREWAEAMEEMAVLRWSEGRTGAARLTLREVIRRYEKLEARWDVERLERLSLEWASRPIGATSSEAEATSDIELRLAIPTGHVESQGS